MMHGGNLNINVSVRRFHAKCLLLCSILTNADCVQKINNSPLYKISQTPFQCELVVR
jgi:hypothetical protein